VCQFNKSKSFFETCNYVLKNAEYKKSERKDIKGRKMTLVVEEGEEEDLENWTHRYRDGPVRIPLPHGSICGRFYSGL